MFSFLIFILGSLVGYMIGTTTANIRFKLMPWEILKWNPDCLGYRITPLESTKIKKGDKVYLGMRVDTDRMKPGEEISI